MTEHITMPAGATMGAVHTPAPAAPVGFDPFAHVPADTASLTMLLPDRATETSWRITFSGPAHPQTIAFQEEMRRKNLRIEQQKEQALANRKKYKAPETTLEEERLENVMWVVSRIVSWEGLVIAGEIIHFTQAKAIELLKDPRLNDYFQQMVDFVFESNSFTKTSA